MRSLFPLAFAIVLFAAGVTSESRGSDLLRMDGDGWYAWHIAGDEDVAIHVRMASGEPREFFLAGLECGNRRAPESKDLGIVDAAESIAWLQRYISPRTDVSMEVMAAISLHHSREAVRVLEDVVRSDDVLQNRKDAVFWLAHSGDEAAFAFLDALLAATD